MLQPSEPRRRKGRFLLAALMTVLLLGAWYTFADPLPKEVTISLPENLDRAGIAETMGKSFMWEPKEIAELESTHAQMQWAAWNAHLRDILTEKFKWNEEMQQAFLVSSALQFEGPELDILSPIYIPGTYEIHRDETKASIAGKLIDPISRLSPEEQREFIANHLNQKAAENIDRYVKSTLELLPDLVPSPAEDLRVSKEGSKILLRFSTIYYNQGEGPLELIADPKTKGIRSDIQRNVYQKIYRKDGGTRDKISGTFLWHQEHLHYHFSDFIIYDLEAVETATPAPDLSGLLTKSTFCIRDISRTDLVLKNRPADAAFKICGKERQGISVGWGDSYFYNYPDQVLNITDLPSGRYKLTFIVNPENLFDESRTDNNRSSVTFDLDMATQTVTVVSKDPSISPKLEHIYLEQDL